jgi:hypothetical protein
VSKERLQIPLAPCREALERLLACVLGSEDLASVRPQAAHDMMTDRTASHVLEVPALRLCTAEWL